MSSVERRPQPMRPGPVAGKPSKSTAGVRIDRLQQRGDVVEDLRRLAHEQPRSCSEAGQPQSPLGGSVRGCGGKGRTRRSAHAVPSDESRPPTCREESVPPCPHISASVARSERPV